MHSKTRGELYIGNCVLCLSDVGNRDVQAWMEERCVGIRRVSEMGVAQVYLKRG